MKKVCEGRFEISEAGEVFKCLDNGSTLKIIPTETIINGRKYLVVTYSENGVQERCYVHRLYAEAYVEKDLGSDYVEALDGDCTNITQENIRWVTRGDILRRTYAQIGEDMKCVECKQIVLQGKRKSLGMCYYCEKKQLRKKAAKRKQEIEKQLAIKEAEAITLSGLSSREKDVVLLRRQGWTFTEIGKHLGITRQRVHSAYKLSERKANQEVKGGK